MAFKFQRPSSDTWYIGWIGADGKEHRRSTRTTNEKAAENILSKVKVELAEGRFLDKKVTSTMTLKAFGEMLYLTRMEKLKPRSIAWRRDRWKRILEVLGAGMTLDQANRLETIEQYVGERLGGKYAGSRTGTVSLATVKEDVAVFRHALRMAVRWKGETDLVEYRLHDWTAPEDPRPPAKPEPVDPEAWKQILEAARARVRRKQSSWADLQGFAVMLLARTLGARRGEVLRLKRADVDLERGIVSRVVLKKRKVGERKETLIEGDPLELLRAAAALHDHDVIFANPKTGHPRTDVAAFWKAVRKDLAKRPNFHAIRHAFGRDFLAGGGGLRELQDRLGHSSYATTEKYAHLAKRADPPKGLPVEMVISGARSQDREKRGKSADVAGKKSLSSRGNVKIRRRAS